MINSRKIVFNAFILVVAFVFAGTLFAACCIGAFSGEGQFAFAAERNRESGAVVIEQTTRRTLYGENENVKLFPASTTKILTALVVLDRLPVQTVVTVKKEAVGIEGSSIYLKEGEKLTVFDLLYGMMLRSGNDAAASLALAVSPSVAAFAELMNETAKSCGAKNSHFVNPHGLHDDNHYTTAHDLALITARAFENADFRKVVNTKIAAVGDGESRRVLGNKNKMLKLMEGANGVKTGYTKNSGRCLVSAAKRNGMQLISVVLNHGDMWNDSIRMLESAFDTFHMQPLLLSQFNDNPQASVVEISARLNGDGELMPKYFPVKKDGTEKIKIALTG